MLNLFTVATFAIFVTQSVKFAAFLRPFFAFSLSQSRIVFNCYSCYSLDISYPVFVDYKDISCYFCEICDVSEALLCLSLCKSRILLNLLVVLFLRYFQLSVSQYFLESFFFAKIAKKIALQIYATAFDQGYSSNFHDSFVSHFPEET